MAQFVPIVRPLSRAAIEREAHILTKRFFPEVLREPGRFPVLELFDLLSDPFGLEPGVEDLSPGVEGATFPDGRVLVSEETYRKAAEGLGRARFTIVHEAYHGIRHRRQIARRLIDTGKLVLHRRQTIPPFQDPEWQADAFASAILMPATMVDVVLDGVSRNYWRRAVADCFGVSPGTAGARLRVLMR